jgi:hypothetical protein
MNKIRIKTTQGTIFDWFLNNYLNLGLWLKGINNPEDATIFCAKRIAEIQHYLKI